MTTAVVITHTNEAADHQRHSSNSYSFKRSLPTVLAGTPTSVAWLETTTLTMTSRHLPRGRTEFELHVVHGASDVHSPLAWTVSRTFDDYVAFQLRLLKTLAYGHACSAECKWLYSFAKKYFPKKALFGNGSKNTMDMRREKLVRYLNVLRSSLLNRGNHSCAIIVTSLANEFTTFVQGRHRLTKLPPVILEVDNEDELSDDEDELNGDVKARRDSTSSSIETDEDVDESIPIGKIDLIAELELVCDLCDCALDGSSDTSDALPCNADGSFCDTTTLRCGHQFHDNCVLPRLAALGFRCPSCQELQL